MVHNIRLQLAALCNGELLIVGSDDGTPWVVNRLSGNGFDYGLPHGSGPVQALDVGVSLPRNQTVADGQW